MNINHNNIEEYLLDYLEGNLDPVITAELMVFLAENPEYEELIRDNRRYAVISGQDQFPDADSLKRNYKDIAEINENNFDEFCIAASEGLLGTSDMERLYRYIGEDSLKIKNLKLFNSLKLIPDSGIQFPGKAKLKKTRGLYIPRRYLYYSLVIAASITVVLLLTLNKPQDLSSEQPAILSNNSISEPSGDMTPEINTEPSLPGVNSSSHSGYRINPKAGSEENPVISGNDHVNSSAREAVDLSQLEPIAARVNPTLKDNELSLEKLRTKQEVHEAKPEQQLHIESENLFAGLLQKINFWKTAETAINGFNYLTEADVSIGKITDEQGRLTRLTLNTESYSIEGKLK